MRQLVLKLRETERAILTHLLEEHIFSGSYFRRKDQHYKMCKELLEKLKTNMEEARIGKIRKYKGKFRLAKTDNILKFCQNKSLLKETKPEIDINEDGIYVGKGMFKVYSMPNELFYED